LKIFLEMDHHEQVRSHLNHQGASHFDAKQKYLVMENY
jgi:hypothetical protein